MPGLITIPEFVKETRDDFNSPTTSTFGNRITQCRETINRYDEVCFLYIFLFFIFFILSINNLLFIDNSNYFALFISFVIFADRGKYLFSKEEKYINLFILLLLYTLCLYNNTYKCFILQK